VDQEQQPLANSLVLVKISCEIHRYVLILKEMIKEMKGTFS
jgi:hypothetical protein